MGSNFADFTFYKNSDWRTWPLRENTLYTGINIGVTENPYDDYSNTNIEQRQPTWVMPIDNNVGTAFFTGTSTNRFYDNIRSSKEI